MELIVCHMDKGCLQYPLPCEEMYVDTRLQPRTGLQGRMALQGTSKVESMWRSTESQRGRHDVVGIGQLPEELCEPYVWFP